MGLVGCFSANREVGFVYTIHSTGAGSLSESAALGVPLSRLKHMGGYIARHMYTRSSTCTIYQPV